MINKGPSSGKVLEFIHSIPCEALMGNHEWGLLKYVDQKKKKEGLVNIRFNDMLNQMGDKKAFYLDWLRNLPPYIEGPDFLAVHGGLVPGVPLSKQKVSIMTKIRTWGGDENDLDNPKDPPWFELYTGSKLVIYGHWAMMGLTVREKTIGLDSACVWGGALSALILPSKEIVQVKAQRAYADPLI